MKALKYIFFLLLIAIIGFAMYIAVQPNTYSFSSSKIIEAPVSMLYDRLIEAKDSVHFLKQTQLNSQPLIVTIENIESKRNHSIQQKAEFKSPFEASSTIDWSFNTDSSGTEVTATMKGEQDFKSKLLTFFTGSIASKTIPYFENSLTKLDSLVQVEMSRYSIEIKGVTEHSGGFYLYSTAASKLLNFEEKSQEMFGEIGSYALANNITMAGKPFVIYHKWDAQNDTVMFSCAIPTNSKITTNEPDILTGKLETFKAVKTILKGNYKNQKEAWDKTMQYISETNLEMPAEPIRLEIYITNKSETPNPANWLTELFIEVN